VKRAANLSAVSFAFRGARLRHREILGESDEGIQFGVDFLRPLDIVSRKFDRRKLPGSNKSAKFGDRLV
jgi:hypothetical protein